MFVSAYLILVHRATVRRSATTYEDGRARHEWSTVAEDVPVLLDANKGQDEQTGDDQTRDRTGQLLAAARSDLLPGDHLTMTRGPSGTFRLEPDPAERWGFHGLSHREFSTVEVSRV